MMVWLRVKCADAYLGGNEETYLCDNKDPPNQNVLNKVTLELKKIIKK